LTLALSTDAGWETPSGVTAAGLSVDGLLISHFVLLMVRVSKRYSSIDRALPVYIQWIRTKDTDWIDHGLVALWENRFEWEYRSDVKVQVADKWRSLVSFEKSKTRSNRGAKECQDALVLMAMSVS
jgi:hypothetical protein